MTDHENLDALKRRILLPFQVQRGTRVWAPWGVSGWSAIEVVRPSRKWAKGYRVKPTNEERGAQARIPLDRLLRRDLSLKGKDKPDLSPDEVFAHMTKPEKPKEPDPPSPPPPPPAATEPEKPLTKAQQQKLEKERTKSIQRLLDMFSDRSTTDDW